MSKEKKVAVIGAGMTGICALRRLSEDKSFQLTCFERNYELGGLWLYTDQTKEDDYGRTIQTGVYNHMRTNLPKQLMEIEGFPMDAYECFPTHREVLGYLNKIAYQCDIRKYIKFNTEVQSVKPVNRSTRDTKWLLTYGDIRKKKDSSTEEFDAVIICSGNCTTPNYPIIDGESDFEGLVIHSIKYRHPEMFAGQTVAVLGAKYSGIDISFELCKFARKVYLCHKGPKLETTFQDNIEEKNAVFRRFTSSSVILDNDEELQVDTVLYCTGYKNSFPFLHDVVLKISPNNLVCNLFKYIMPAQYSTLFFMGITREVPFFPSSDHQALFIKAVLDGSAKLPAVKEMAEIIEKDSKRILDPSNWWDLDKEQSSIAGNFQPIQSVVKKIFDYHNDVCVHDFSKLRKFIYKTTGPDSFIIL